MTPGLKKVFGLLASLKVAIPLLVLLTGVTIIASLYPDPEIFGTWWYLSLLGLQGLSLLLVTIQHIPSILKKKGRNTLIGVVTTHLGILVLIAGIIYGGYAGERYEEKIIEGEVALVSGLPFAIQLSQLDVEEYEQSDFPRMNLDDLPKKKQDSHITLLVAGQPVFSAVVAPGKPAKFDGYTLLPSMSDIGWYFELVVRDLGGIERTIPVEPWSPPLITLAGRRLMTHSLITGDQPQAEFFTIENGEQVSLGMLTKDRPLKIDRYEIFLGPVKRYTSIYIYKRPHGWVLVLGSLMMFGGLVWHFYFRHRDRRKGNGG